MILNIILLLIILSLESTIGLPVFFIFLSYKLISHRQERLQIVALFMMALLLAIFYSLSWSLLSLLIFVFHLVWQRSNVNQPLLKLFGFLLLNLFIFFLANLQLNYFYLMHLPVFIIYFYKTSFKKYAS